MTEGTETTELLDGIEGSIATLRAALLRYEREIDPDSAYVLSDYLLALRKDAHGAAERDDRDALRRVLHDLEQLERDTQDRLDHAEASGGNPPDEPR